MLKKFNIRKTRKNKVELNHLLSWEYIEKYSRQMGKDWTQEIAVVIQKDGCIQQTYGFRGNDLESCSPSYINGVYAYFNNCVKRLGDGWMVSIEAQRFMTKEYPEAAYENLTGYLVDSERKEMFQTFGEHFDSSYYITFVYKPEIQLKKDLVKVFFNDTGYQKQIEEQIQEFLKVVDRMTGILQEKLILRPLDYVETAQYLHSTVSLSRHKMHLPDHFLFIDSYVSDQVFEVGMTSKLGEYYIPILAIADFPSETYPAILHELNKMRIEYRWVSRFFPLSKPEAMKELEKWQKKHFAGQKSMKQNMQEIALHVDSPLVNQGAVAQQGDVEQAQAEVETDIVGLGYYNSCLMVWDKDYHKAHEKLKILANCIEQSGFMAKEEDFNSYEAFLGMTAGEVYHNIRRPLVSTGNYCHVLPLSAVWSGIEYNKFTNEVCGCDAPLLTCSTNYGTPFYFNLNEGDVGHTLIFGPTGSGKSVLLNTIAAGFLKYNGAQIFMFDKGLSALTLTMAVGGQYVNPAVNNISFQPFADIDNPQERYWAVEFVEILLAMQGVEMSPQMSVQINATLEMMGEIEKKRRTITTLMQNCNYRDDVTGKNTITEALTPYSLAGAYGHIFDGNKTSIQEASWILFEMESLMEMGPKVVSPAITYLFHFLERRFTGRLTLLALDECWIFLDHPVFAQKMKEWLKVLRKKNVFCVFATQNVSDASESKIAPTLIGSCPTKIYLADPKAIELQDDYRKFGLTDDEIGIISMATKKRDYYYKSTSGTRLFQLGLGKIALSLCTQQQQTMIDENGGEYRWHEYCEYLLDKKQKTGWEGGLVEPILDRLGVNYQKYVEGITYEKME